MTTVSVAMWMNVFVSSKRFNMLILMTAKYVQVSVQRIWYMISIVSILPTANRLLFIFIMLQFDSPRS